MLDEKLDNINKSNISRPDKYNKSSSYKRNDFATGHTRWGLVGVIELTI